MLVWCKLENFFNMTNFDRDEAVMKFCSSIAYMGVDEARACGGKRWRYRPDRKFEFD